MNRSEIEKQLLTKATQDPAFRQALVSDPRSTIEKELGLKVPASVKLQVVEESSSSLCLVLPAAEGELTDMELEGVAGGKMNPTLARPAYLSGPGAGSADDRI